MLYRMMDPFFFDNDSERR